MWYWHRQKNTIWQEQSYGEKELEYVTIGSMDCKKNTFSEETKWNTGFFLGSSGQSWNDLSLMELVTDREITGKLHSSGKWL